MATAAIALLSGGLDSTVSLALWLADHPGQSAVALTIDYHQRPRQQELKAAAAIAAHYGLEHKVVALPWLADWLPTGLQTDGATHQGGQLSTADVWVPNRNGLFLNLAAGLAEALGATTVLFGANREEAEAGFPDNTVAFRQTLNEALKLSTLNQVQVVAPVETLTKADIVSRGIQLAVPFDLIWSCYEAGPTQCGQCASCQLLVQGVAHNGLTLSTL